MTLDHLYIRYFDYEYLGSTPEEIIDFLKSLPSVEVTLSMESDIKSYYQSKMPYPKRYKVGARRYFILIKSAATTLNDFKNHSSSDHPTKAAASSAAPGQQPLDTYCPGWYEVSVRFKRLALNPATNKCQSIDTDFRVRVKAESIQNSYNIVMDHLRNRHDVDLRSQFPSIKGKNFSARYLGLK